MTLTLFLPHMSTSINGVSNINNLSYSQIQSAFLSAFAFQNNQGLIVKNPASSTYKLHQQQPTVA